MFTDVELGSYTYLSGTGTPALGPTTRCLCRASKSFGITSSRFSRCSFAYCVASTATGTGLIVNASPVARASSSRAEACAAAVVLHREVEVEVLGLGEDRAEYEHENHREGEREEHRRAFAIEALEPYAEIGDDDPWRHAARSRARAAGGSAVSFRNTSSRLGLRTSRPPSASPHRSNLLEDAADVLGRLHRDAEVCRHPSGSGQKPSLRIATAAAGSIDFSVSRVCSACSSVNLAGESMATIRPLEMIATVSARSSASSM